MKVTKINEENKWKSIMLKIEIIYQTLGKRNMNYKKENWRQNQSLII